MEEKLKDLKDVNFIFTDDMKQTLFDMMAIQKLLESDDLDYREQKELEKERRLSEVRSSQGCQFWIYGFNNNVKSFFAVICANMKQFLEM